MYTNQWRVILYNNYGYKVLHAALVHTALQPVVTMVAYQSDKDTKGKLVMAVI